MKTITTITPRILADVLNLWTDSPKREHLAVLGNACGNVYGVRFEAFGLDAPLAADDLVAYCEHVIEAGGEFIWTSSYRDAAADIERVVSSLMQQEVEA